MSKIPITVTVDEEVFEEFKKLCENNDIKISTKVNSLIKEWVNNHNKKDRWTNGRAKSYSNGRSNG